MFGGLPKIHFFLVDQPFKYLDLSSLGTAPIPYFLGVPEMVAF